MKARLLFLLTVAGFALATAGCSGGSGSLSGPLEGDGTLFEGGDPVLGHAEVALDYFADGLERIANGATEGLCEKPADDAVAHSVGAVLDALTTVQRFDCQRGLAALAPSWLAALRSRRPKLSLRMGPLTVFVPGAATATEVSAKTLPVWGSEILVDIARARLLDLTELAALLAHETGHQITGLKDWSPVTDFRDGRHWLDVIVAAGTAMGFRQAPHRSLALAPLGPDKVALLGISADGMILYRLLNADGAPIADWALLGVEKGFQHLVATTDSTHRVLLFALDAAGHPRLLVARDGEDPFGGTWQTLPELAIAQLAAGRLADGRVVLAALDRTAAKAIHVLVEDTAGSLHFPTAWTRSGLNGVRHFAVERMGDGKLWFLGFPGQPAAPTNSTWNYLYASDATLAAPATLAWTALPGASLAATADAPFEPSNGSTPRLMPLGGTGRQLLLSQLGGFVRYHWDASWVPRVISQPAQMFPAFVYRTAAIKHTGDRLLVALMRFDGTLVAGREGELALDFRGRWHNVGFSEEVAALTAPARRGSVDIPRCNRRPHLEGSFTYYSGPGDSLVPWVAWYDRAVCTNPLHTTLSWQYRRNDYLLDGNYRISTDATRKCLIRFGRCTSGHAAGGSTFDAIGVPGSMASIGACFLVGVTKWEACGRSRYDRLSVIFSDAQYNYQLDFGGDLIAP